MLLNLFGCTRDNNGNGGRKRDRGVEGTCGDNITWKYDKSKKTLTISGTGDMVTPEKYMWSDYEIKKLVISEGITSIDVNAFYSNHSLTGELKLPESLKEIGEFAFYGCDGLKGYLIIQDSV